MNGTLIKKFKLSLLSIRPESLDVKRKPIGGWLIVFLLIFVFQTISGIFRFFTEWQYGFSPDTFKTFVPKDSPAHAPFVAYYMFSGAVILLVDIVVLGSILIGFFRKSHWVPKAVIGLMVIRLLVILPHYFGQLHFLSLLNTLEIDTSDTPPPPVATIIGFILSYLIVIAYFIRSKRVADTFV